MKTYKVHIDISDIFNDIKHFKIREYYQPFMCVFIQAKNPDDACHKVLTDLIKSILKKNNNINTRIFCRLIKYNLRIEKVYSS